MKKNILTIALGFALAMPMAGMSYAQQHGIVASPESNLFSGSNLPSTHPVFNQRVDIAMTRQPFDMFGGLINPVCRIRVASKAVLLEERRDVVKVRMTSGNCHDKVGWIVKAAWRAVQNSNAQQAVNAQKVFTGGRWGNEVPVFRSRGMYYSARTSMDRNGHYRGQSRSVACKLRVGTQVEFMPFRDWGTGQVRSGNCKGWTDRAVIR